MATETGSTYTLGGVINEIVDKNIRLFPILFKQFKHLQYAFFDVKQLAGEGGMSLKPKEIPGIEPSLTVDGYSVKWLDYALFDFTTTVTATNASLAVTGGDITLVVGDTSGFSANDTIHVIASTNGDQIDGIVKSITNSTTLVVTVTRKNINAAIGSTVKVEAAQVVERGSWRRNDNDEIVRPAGSFNYKEYQSFVQHFSRRIEFTKSELNKVYKYEGEAKEEAAKRFAYNLGVLVQEVNKMIYKGRNIGPGAGATDKLEMLGLEQICIESNSVIDLGSSASPVKDLFAQLELSFRSGALMGEEPLMLLVNDKFLAELSLSNADKVRYDKYVDELKFEVPTLSTIFGNVDIVRDPMLNRLYSYSAAYVVPRSLVKLFVRENQSFEPNRGITRADQSVRLYPVIHNLREKQVYDLDLELGLIAGGLSASEKPFRFIKNFKSA